MTQERGGGRRAQEKGCVGEASAYLHTSCRAVVEDQVWYVWCVWRGGISIERGESMGCAAVYARGGGVLGGKPYFLLVPLTLPS